ncbi:condensation domain-containing protein, partial [Mycobacterium sp. E342]|uniref:condensation domain-containing protein n=1 Tax=Mycobacterium sp. E342 TaxID=1834147 RepID=UPI000B29B54E
GDPYRAPGNLTEEMLAGIYAEILGLDRVGIDDSFFDLGGDSILSMQVVARARAAGLLCRPRDVFIEQTVARLARVAEVAVEGAPGVADEGIGPVVATPIMRWLQSFQGSVDEFNQTMVLRAPSGVSDADVAVVLQALLDQHAMLRLRIDDDGAGRWALRVPEPGAVDARECVITVNVLSEGALVAARSQLKPATGVVLRAVWAQSTGQLALIVHHLAVDGVSWRILLEDLNIAWAQHNSGQRIALPTPGTSFARWAELLPEHARRPEVVAQAEAWRQVAAAPALLPAVHPEVDTYLSAGQLSVSLDVETTRLLLGEVPVAFHTGVQDILLIAFGLAWAQFGGTREPIGIDVEGHGRDEELAPYVDLSRTVGWFTIKYPVALAVDGLSWGQVTAGDAALGAFVKNAKEQLRALPDPVTYGLLRYLNTEVELGCSDPTIAFNYLGRLGSPAAQMSDGLWRLDHESLPLIAAAAAVLMPLGHTVELNVATLDTATGPRLQANWTWALSALDHAQINRLSRLWFDALTGICTHVRNGGGGFTPSDIVPARLSQPQIDELQSQYRIADILPLTPLQEGLLFHALQDRGDDLYVVQLEIALGGAIDQRRLREAVRTVVERHPNLVARFCSQFDVAVQIIPAEPVANWYYVDLDADGIDLHGQIQQLCADERAAVCDPTNRPVFRAALIRTAPDRHRFVLSFHHIVLDGWSVPILMQEIFASYYGQQLGAPVPYRRFVTWLADRDLEAARAAWREALDGLESPTLVGPAGRVARGQRAARSYRVSGETTQALRELARSCHTTVNTVLQAGWAQLLCGLTGQLDVAFGIAVSGRPAELIGAESMVGLLINTVPVRATITATTTTVDLLEQLHRIHNNTLEHQHLALNEIHRATSHDQLFDTLFVYQNYPVDTNSMAGAHELAINEFSSREYNHYPLTLQVAPGQELGMRVEFDTDVFDGNHIQALVTRFQRVLEGMTADPTQRVSWIDMLDESEHACLEGWGNRAVLVRPAASEVSIPDAFAAQVARTPEAMALTFGDRSITYQELDESANRLAHLLVSHGVGSGECVGLLVERGAQAIVAILGVLKSGAAYVPMDPGWPAARIEFVLTDATPVVVLTASGLRSRLDGHDVPVIDVNDPVIDTQPATSLRGPAPDADDIAYLIYTSGTTGIPKGVAVTHHNVIELLASAGAYVERAGVWSQWHSYAFDVSVWEIFGALLGGGRLVVVPEAAVGSPHDFHAVLVTEQVRVL